MERFIKIDFRTAITCFIFSSLVCANEHNGTRQRKFHATTRFGHYNCVKILGRAQQPSRHFPERQPLGRNDITLDTNQVIVLTKFYSNKTLSPNEIPTLEKTLTLLNNSNQRVRLSKYVKAEIERDAMGVKVGRLMRTYPTEVEVLQNASPQLKTEYKRVLAVLEDAKVGREKGDLDRLILADLLFAKVEPGAVRTFITSDRAIVQRLFWILQGRPTEGRSSKPLIEPMDRIPSSFDVFIEGRRIRIKKG